MTIEKGIIIGVIGTSNNIDAIKKEFKEFPSFNPIYRVCQNDERDMVLEAIRELTGQVEVLFFSSYEIYQIAIKKSLDISVPIHFVPLTGTGLYSALYRLKHQNGFEAISVDTFSEDDLESSLQELPVRPKTIHYYTEITSKSATTFHCELINKGLSKGVLTASQTISNWLTEQNIPNALVRPTSQDIVATLEKAILSTKTRKGKEAQIVVGIIHIDNYFQNVETKSSEFEIQKLKLEIHKVVLGYVKKLDGHLTNLGGGQYLFITTRGVFERETRGYKSMLLLQIIKKSFNITLSIGVGFGTSANEAGKHARLSLRQAHESGGNVCYIVREDRSVLGPVETGESMIYNLSITDPELLEKANKAGMTASYMSRLMAQVARFGKINYTAKELAKVLDVTVRSAHRILLQWLDAGLTEIIGEEKETSRGRPRKIYNLSFLNHTTHEKDQTI